MPGRVVRHLAVGLVTGWCVVLPAVTAVAASTKPSSPKVVTCAMTAVVEPTNYVIACADANASVTALHWKSWSARRAIASGKFSFNTCTPTCVAGKQVNDPATITLSAPKTVKKYGVVFTSMSVAYRGTTFESEKSPVRFSLGT